MADYDMPDEEFERLYALELELRNELADNEKLRTNHLTATLDTSTNDASTVIENPVTLDKSLLDDAAFYDELKEQSFYCNEKDPVTVKRRLLEDVLFSEEHRETSKRRKSSLPLVGYEINHSPTIDPDIEMIDRIISHRKTLQNIGHSSFSLNEKSQSFIRKKKCTFHHRIPAGDFQSITTEFGKRFYLDVQDEKVFEISVESMGEVKENARLLSQSYNDLRMEAEKELLSLNAEILSEDINNSSRSSNEVDEPNDSELWVNKYKPRNYLDLLSDEATNRTVLQWMKLWDKIVFGCDPRSRRKEKVARAKPKFINKFAPEVLDELDELGRPQQKAVLLCGPPGLGKTTLAHIIANHAGYNAVEMNASDDRSVESFRTNLENATSMQSVFAADKRPNCLIIDEIDGAPASSINFLVGLLQAKKPKNEPTKTKKKDKFTLLRPVICICNDLYIPSLRPLRQISLVIQFPPTHSTRLAQRLHFISRKQRMKADLSVLLALCSKTENDIRACLSVLQFVRITSGELKFLDLEGVSVGQKDYQRSLFSVWRDIFTLSRPKREPRANPHRQHSEAKDILGEMTTKERCDLEPLASRFSHVLKMAQSCGEYEKLTLGWFENYPHTKFKHMYLEPVTAGLEWATMTDLFQKEILHNQKWSLGTYIPLSFVAYHFLFASNSWSKLQFPNRYHEFSSKLVKSKGLLDVLGRGMSAYVQFFSPNLCLVQDILPYLVFILQPSFRPVNVQLFNKKEKEELSQLVNTMICYNLTYQQEKSVEGTYTFTLDPNLEEIAHFPSLPKPRALPYSSKQLIAREIELEKVRRSENYFSSQTQNSKNSSLKDISNKCVRDGKSEEKIEPNKKNSKNETKSSVPNHLQKLEVKKLNKIKKLNVVAKDFFGRVITASEEDQKGSESNILKSDIWFKFKEGYSNAVRRPLKLKEFFISNS